MGVNPKARVINAALRVGMFHDDFAGAESLPLVVAGTKNHDVAADFRVLSGIKVDENTPFVCHLDGGDSLPSPVVISKTLFQWVDIQSCGLHG